MTTATMLLLLMAAASTIAFSPQEGSIGPENGHRFLVDVPVYPWLLVRRRRDVPAASKSGSGAVSFASSGSGSGSSSGFSGRGGYSDGTQGYNSVNPSGFAFPGADGYGAQSPYVGYQPADFNSLFQQYLTFMEHLAQQQAYATNDISSRAAYPAPNDYGFAFPEATNYGGSGGVPSDGGAVSAHASASLGPRGGFGSVSISPPPQGNPELGTRMGSVPPSDGNNFSVSSFSSSSSSDVDGVRKSSKEATSVINDNGKVTTYHVGDP